MPPRSHPSPGAAPVILRQIWPKQENIFSRGRICRQTSLTDMTAWRSVTVSEKRYFWQDGRGRRGRINEYLGPVLTPPFQQTNRVEPGMALRCTVERRMGCRGFLKPHSSRAPTARPGSGTQPSQSGIFLLPADCISWPGSVVFSIFRLNICAWLCSLLIPR